VYTWLEFVLRRLFRHRESGQTEVIIAVILLIVLLMLSGRRVVVQ